MPAIQCPACGHRHFQLVAECINCGEPLAAPYSSAYPDEDVCVAETSSANRDEDDEVAEYERFLAESRQENAERLRISAEASFPRSSPDRSARKSKNAGLRVPREQPTKQALPLPTPDAPADDNATSRQLVRRQSDQLV